MCQKQRGRENVGDKSRKDKLGSITDHMASFVCNRKPNSNSPMKLQYSRPCGRGEEWAHSLTVQNRELRNRPTLTQPIHF